MVAHVSPAGQQYTETLSTVQLASRIHRMRRRRFKVKFLFVIGDERVVIIVVFAFVVPKKVIHMY